MKWVLFVFVVLFIGTSCDKNDSKYPYAIKDFSKALRPSLYQIVSNGLIGVDYRSEMFLEDSTSLDNLRKLSYCEHPLIRAVAIRGLLKRDTLHQNDIILSHLTDTAFIVTEISNWRQDFTGIHFSNVADIMIDYGKWKSFSDRQKILDAVILKHNYLNAAYEILTKIDPPEKYYSSLKEMVQRDRKSDFIFDAVVALSKFRGKENFEFLKQFIVKNNEELKIPSFVIIETKETAFFDHFDSLRVRIQNRAIPYQSGVNITWKDYEPID